MGISMSCDCFYKKYSFRLPLTKNICKQEKVKFKVFDLISMIHLFIGDTKKIQIDYEVWKLILRSTFW